MSVRVSVSGLRELDVALGELPKATARNALKRVLIKAGQPVADAASAMAPKDTGELSASVKVGSRISNRVGSAEFAAVMRAGGTKGKAVSALRGARRAAAGQGSFAEAYIGPTKAKSKKDAIKRIVQEFGSSVQPGRPYLRPAWDGGKDKVLAIIKDDLGDEIIRTAKRAAKRNAAKALKLARG